MGPGGNPAAAGNNGTHVAEGPLPVVHSQNATWKFGVGAVDSSYTRYHFTFRSTTKRAHLPSWLLRGTRATRRRSFLPLEHRQTCSLVHGAWGQGPNFIEMHLVAFMFAVLHFSETLRHLERVPLRKNVPFFHVLN